MIFEDFEAIAKRLKRIQAEEQRVDKTWQSKQELDDAIDDYLIGNEDDGNMGYEDFRDQYAGCDF